MSQPVISACIKAGRETELKKQSKRKETKPLFLSVCELEFGKSQVLGENILVCSFVVAVDF